MAIALSAAGCGLQRGELVESNFADGDDVVELAFTDDPDAIEVDNPLEDYELVEIQPDEPAPGVFEFEATDAFTGESVAGTSLFRGTPMILAFVTPTCPVCVQEGPKLATSAALNPDVDYLVIHSGGTPDQYQSYADEAGLYDANVMHLADGETELWSWFGVLGQPSYVLVDSQGAMLSSFGALQDHGLARAVELIADDPTT